MISLLIDKKDYINKLSNDDVINIIGLKGSGKSTLSKQYITNDDYIVISTDRLYSMPTDEKDSAELISVRQYLLDKYGTIPNDESFINCYLDIIDYCKNKNKKLLIEGNVLQQINPTMLKGLLIVKQTASLKCFYRSVKRDYPNSYYMNLEKEKHPYTYNITRLISLSKRRSKIFREAKDLNKIIKKMERSK